MAKVRAKRTLAYGVGVNDADYPVVRHEIVGGVWKITWKCPIYAVWRSMLTRSYSTRYQARKPTYAGCSVAKEWHRFSSFRAWVITQDWRGKQLDKDLIHVGNKVYGPEFCCFISGTINSFLTDSSAARGVYPQGVSWHRKLEKVQARCGNPITGKEDYLGVFDCPNEAHLAWATRKLEHAHSLAAGQADKTVSSALIARFASVHAQAEMAAQVSLT